VLEHAGVLGDAEISKVQSVDQRMRLECGVGFRQLRTCRRTRPGQLCATSGCEQSQQTNSLYSITSSARASSVGGSSRPIAFAVLRLMISSYLVGCWSGSSVGLRRRRSQRIRPSAEPPLTLSVNVQVMNGTGGRRQFIPKAARLGSRAAFDLASRSAQWNTKV
jgi:hypothetical protein